MRDHVIINDTSCHNRGKNCHEMAHILQCHHSPLCCSAQAGLAMITASSGEWLRCKLLSHSQIFMRRDTGANTCQGFMHCSALLGSPPTIQTRYFSPLWPSYAIILTSFQAANNVSILGGKGDFPNCSVTAPPPLTMKSNHPSSLVIVYPSLR